MASRDHSCSLHSVIATISKQHDLLRMTYSILVGAPGSGYEAPDHGRGQRIAWVRTDLVSDLILRMRKYEDQRLLQTTLPCAKAATWRQEQVAKLLSIPACIRSSAVPEFLQCTR